MVKNVTISTIDNSICTAAAEVENSQWLIDGGFIAVIYSIILMFWGITFVCEEYGVPSLRRFCNRHKFSDALTGSLFIGTGLSLPVFFIALVGLFASDSAIGVGTVIGGNAFNHLITIPSSIYVSPLYTMKLDPVVFTREMLCYFFTCLLLIWATQNQSLRYGFNNSFDENQWQSCLSISWFSSLVLMIAYFAYCFLTVYGDSACSWMYQMFLISGLGYKRSETNDHNDATRPIDPESGTDSNSKHQVGTQINEGEERASHNRKKEGTDEEIDRVEVEITFTQPVPSTTNSLPQKTCADNEEINTNQSPARGIEDFYPDDEEEIIARNSAFDFNFSKSMISEKLPNTIITPQRIAEEMFTVPDPLPEKIFYYLMYPMKLAIYLTVPDVRLPQYRERAIVAFTITLIWLAIQSYILTVSLTLIGNWWNVNGAIMGLTVAAWAGNYPAHWSSLVVAKKGDGDIASCNVYGSNVFNNCVGLGLPWVLYCLVYKKESYDALQDQGVVLSLMLLMVIIVIHYIMALMSNFVFTSWMIPVMVGMYLGFLSYVCYFLASNF